MTVSPTARWSGKTATRLPESFMLDFRPPTAVGPPPCLPPTPLTHMSAHTHCHAAVLSGRPLKTIRVQGALTWGFDILGEWVRANETAAGTTEQWQVGLHPPHQPESITAFSNRDAAHGHGS